MTPGPRERRSRVVVLLALAAVAAAVLTVLAAGAGGGDGGDEAAASTATAAPSGAAAGSPRPPAGASDAVVRGGGAPATASPAEPAAGGPGAAPPESAEAADTAPDADDEASRGAVPDRPGPDAVPDRPGSEAAPAPPEVAEILARAERAYSSLGSLRARFRQTIEVPLLERRREGHGIWYQKGRDRFRMDFEEPPEDEIVADGTWLWLYYPSTNPKQVIRTDLASGRADAATADVLARILSEARTNYSGEYVRREEVSGVSTHLISLRPLGRSPYARVRVWIGVEDHLVRRFEITEENETVRTVTLADLRPDAAIPDPVFRFEPPPDADVFSR